MGSAKVVLWNCAGFRNSADSTPAKFTFLDTQFPKARFEIAALVETHHKDSQDFSADLGHYFQTHHILDSPVKNETHSGIIVLVCKDFDIIGHLEPLPGRLFNIKLRKNDKLLNLSIFYGPQWGKIKKNRHRNHYRAFLTCSPITGR